MRVIVVLAMVVSAILFLVVPPVSAQFDVGFMGGPVNQGIPYVVGPCFTFAAPFSQGSAILLMANSSALAHDFAGSLAIAFPAFASPVTGGTVVSPVIGQTTSETIVATDMYYFADFISG